MNKFFLILVLIASVGFIASASASAVYYATPNYYYSAPQPVYRPSYYNPGYYPTYNYGTNYYANYNSGQFSAGYYYGSNPYYYNPQPYVPYAQGTYCQYYCYYVNGYRYCRC